MIQLARIREKLDALRQRDTACLVHGAETHRYNLKPVLSQAEAAAFEKEFRVRLPEEYSAFLMEVGNGGAGPGYGLYSLANSANELRDQQRWGEEREKPVPQLDRPFPLTTAVADALNACWQVGPIRGSAPPHVATGFRLDGIMDICHHGCTAYAGLVLSGEQRGCVWGCGGPGYRWGPLGRGPGSRSFLDWYEAWLDQWLAPNAIDRWATLTGHT